MTQDFVGALADYRAEVGRDDGCRIDDREAQRLRLLARPGFDPVGLHAEGRVAGLDALDHAEHAARIDGEFAIGHDRGLRHGHSRERDAIAGGRQVEVVAYVDGWHQEAELLRQLQTHAANARQQLAAVRLVDQRHEAIADLETDAIDRLDVLPRQFFALHRCRRRRQIERLARLALGLGATTHQQIGGIRADAGCGEEHEVRHARNDADHGEHARADVEHARVAEQLLRHLIADVLLARHAGDDDRDRGRQQQRRDLRGQAVADSKQRVDRDGVAEAHVVHQRTDRDAAEDVDEQDEDAGDGIASHELAGTVHRTVEVSFRTHFAAAHPRLVLGDESGVEVGVDRHLLAGHGVEGETRRHFGDTAGTFGDDHEVDDRQDDEHHDADGIVAADDEMTEGLDHMPRRIRPGVAFAEHHTCRGDVECKAEQGRDEQDRRKDCEVERLADRKHRDQHQ